MDGFRFSLSETNIEGQQPSHPCLNLLFPSWTLDTREKFYLAIVGVFFASFCLEGLSAWRYRIVQSVRHQQQRHRQQQSTSTGTAQASSSRSTTLPPPVSTQGLRFVVTLLHGLQGLLGYLVMLAVMTYSAELLFSVVLGLALGYAAFFQFEEAFGRVHVTSNPCCSFLKGEAREITPVTVQGPENDDNDDNVVDRQMNAATLTTPLLSSEVDGERGTLITEGGGGEAEQGSASRDENVPIEETA
jgi:hypothetical protein